MGHPLYPALYQVNTRVWLGELSRRLGRPATLDDVSDEWLDNLAAEGFDLLYLLGVWQTGEYALRASRTSADWRREAEATLPDLTDADFVSSPFAITAYTTHTDFGGDAALSRLRQRLRQRGLRLVLDFVPNHTAVDHPWVWRNSEYYLICDGADLAREPQNYCRVPTRLGSRVLAYGRDPYYPGWPDTVQLNYRCRALRQAMTDELRKVADRCDGVRCDMAMLLLPEVIQRIWGRKSLPIDGTPPIDASFWPEAIPRVRTSHPDFLFLAEVYWDLEWELQQQGFDYTYDKRLYDRLLGRDAAAVRGHLHADAGFQKKSVRFLENHDELRVAAAFPPDLHRAAAVVTYLVPGLRFFHDGQFDGRRRRVSMHVGHRPNEPVDEAIRQFYDRLLACLTLSAVRDGTWRLLDCRPAWNGNATWERFIAFAWDGAAGEHLLVVVNYAPMQGQCYAILPWSDLPGKSVRMRDRLSEASYDRDGNDLARRGLYFDMPAWRVQVFEVRTYAL
jgi:hypothetical protein